MVGDHVVMQDARATAIIGAMIGVPARANMLVALVGGQALTATELALHAGVTQQTASSHLKKMIDTGLLKVEKQGRHRYYRLADARVAEALEPLAHLVPTTPVVHKKTLQAVVRTQGVADVLRPHGRRFGGDRGRWPDRQRLHRRR